jgi:hypothetical protein
MKINYGNFISKVDYKYLSGGDCDMDKTIISMNGLNPNFVFVYRSGRSIKVSFNNFTTNN